MIHMDIAEMGSSGNADIMDDYLSNRYGDRDDVMRLSGTAGKQTLNIPRPSLVNTITKSLSQSNQRMPPRSRVGGHHRHQDSIQGAHAVIY